MWNVTENKQKCIRVYFSGKQHFFSELYMSQDSGSHFKHVLYRNKSLQVLMPVSKRVIECTSSMKTLKYPHM